MPDRRYRGSGNGRSFVTVILPIPTETRSIHSKRPPTPKRFPEIMSKNTGDEFVNKEQVSPEDRSAQPQVPVPAHLEDVVSYIVKVSIKEVTSLLEGEMSKRQRKRLEVGRKNAKQIVLDAALQYVAEGEGKHDGMVNTESESEKEKDKEVIYDRCPNWRNSHPTRRDLPTPAVGLRPSALTSDAAALPGRSFTLSSDGPPSDTPITVTPLQTSIDNLIAAAVDQQVEKTMTLAIEAFSYELRAADIESTNRMEKSQKAAEVDCCRYENRLAEKYKNLCNDLAEAGREEMVELGDQGDAATLVFKEAVSESMVELQQHSDSADAKMLDFETRMLAILRKTRLADRKA